MKATLLRHYRELRHGREQDTWHDLGWSEAGYTLAQGPNHRIVCRYEADADLVLTALKLAPQLVAEVERLEKLLSTWQVPE